MDPRNAAVDPTDPRRKQHRVRLARLSATLLSPIHQHPSRLHRQEIPHHAENEVPRHRPIHRRLRTTRPKSPLPFRITRNESTIPSWSAKRRSRGRHEISHTHYLPRAHREGPRKCTLESIAPKRIWRKQKLWNLCSPTTAPSMEQPTSSRTEP